ncbi:MAG: hypothetical protein HOW73_22880 [Polyangiaceae bacterium]|nr:hypothetical protein [Polyangiaceae bacterium]
MAMVAVAIPLFTVLPACSDDTESAPEGGAEGVGGGVGGAGAGGAGVSDGDGGQPSGVCAPGDVLRRSTCVRALVSSVSSGDRTSCDIRLGEIECWGDNANGQILPGGAYRYSSRTAASLTGPWTMVDTSLSFTYAIAEDGSLWRSGTSESSGEAQVEVLGDMTFRQVSAGSDYACAIATGGSLWCVGSIPGRAPATELQRVGSDDDWVAVSSGFGHACALKRTGELFCWGENSWGQLGNGTLDDRADPVLVGPGWQMAEAGRGRTCGVKADGSLHCWGLVSDGTTSSVPTQVGSDLDWREVNVGIVMLAIRRDGTLWRQGSFNGMQWPYWEELRQVGTDTDWVEIRTTADAACGRRASGDTYCFGLNEWGQLAIGSFGNKEAPAPISGSNIVSISAAPAFTIAVDDEGALLTWGWGAQTPTQIGTDDDWVFASGRVSGGAIKSDGSLWKRHLFDEPTLIDEGRYVHVVGEEDLFAIATDGTLWRFAPCAEPTQVGTQSGWTSVDRQWYRAYGIRDGALFALSVTAGGVALAQVGSATDWFDVTAAPDVPGYSCGIRAPGTLWCWDGTWEPTQVGTDQDWVAVKSGGDKACARKADGSFWCWGEGNFAADAMADAPPYGSMPVQIATGVSDFAVSERHACLRDANGVVRCWGYGSVGELGTGDGFRETPTLVP